MIMILAGCSIDVIEIDPSENTLKEVIQQKTIFPEGGIPQSGGTPVPDNEEDEPAEDDKEDDPDPNPEDDQSDNSDPLEGFISN